MTEAKKEKKKKKKGPIRTEAIVPVFVIIGCIVAFNIFLLDSTIKKAIELIGEQVNSAEVNVGSVNTSFGDLKFTVKNIQVTDRAMPEFNKVVIGEFNFQMLWDALLRGKVVIEKANLGGILINSKRAKKGYVLPEPPASDKASEKTKKVLAEAEKEFEGNVFGDIAGVAGGKGLGSAGQKIESDLASKKGFEKLNAEIDAKNAEMQKKLDALPTKEQISSLQSRLKNMRWKDLGNIAKAPKVLKEADKLKKDIEKATNSIGEANKAVNNSIKTLDQSYKNAQKLVDEDIKNIGKRMNLPSLDPKSIARMLFGNELLDKIKEIQGYQDQAKKYMPTNKGEKEAPIARPRGQGRDYRFGTPNSYPLFWLKLASIDSKNEQGTVAGKIENITTNQRQIGKLTTGTIDADFPAKNVRDVKATMELDHREKPILKMQTTVGSFPVKDKALSNSPDTKFVIKEADTKSVMNVTATEETVDLKMNNTFTKVKYETSAGSKQVQEILDNVARRTKKLTLNAKGKGKWDDIKFDINSNLAQAIKSSTEALVQEKINKAKAKIKADVEGQIAAQRKEIDGKINKLKSQYNSKIAEAKGQLAKIQSDLNKQKKSAQKKAKKQGTKNLLKGIKGIKL